jgi:hypothetical protein
MTWETNHCGQGLEPSATQVSYRCDQLSPFHMVNAVRVLYECPPIPLVCAIALLRCSSSDNDSVQQHPSIVSAASQDSEVVCEISHRCGVIFENKILIEVRIDVSCLAQE